MTTANVTPELALRQSLVGSVSGPTTRNTICSIAAGRGRRVLYLIVGIWILNAFDLLMTIRAHADGVLDEANPIAQAVLPHGTAAMVIFKLGLVALATYSLIRFRRHRCTEVASALVLVAYLGVACQWQLCYDMYFLVNTNKVAVADFGKIDALMRLGVVF